MKPFDPNPMQDWLDDHLEAYLDGTLSEADVATFEEHLARDPAWEAELALATEIQAGLQRLPSLACPPQVTHAVLAEVRHEARSEWLASLLNRFQRYWLETWQPALAMSALVVLVASAALLGGPQRPTAAYDAEVAAAIEEVKWTLAFLSNVSREAGLSVREDVLDKHVLGTMEQALGHERPEQIR